MCSRGRHHVTLIALLFVLYAGVRLLTAPPIVDKPRVLADTYAYARVSRASIATLDFWTNSRPPLFPLLLKAAQQDFDRAAALQLALGTAAWGLLALMVSRQLLHPALRIAGFAIVLLFSLDRHVAGWDFVMMSESLSVTTLAVFMAACLWLLEGWRVRKVVAVLVAALALALARDTNAWMLLGPASVAIMAVALRWTTPRMLVLAAGLALIFTGSNASADKGHRWVFPLANVLTQRVLPDAADVGYFETCGMPVSPGLLRLAGKYANADKRALFTSPELESFRVWLHDRGKQCYVGWLVSSPVRQVRETLYHTGALISFGGVDRFFSNRYTPLLPSQLGGFLYPQRFTLWIWGLSTLTALAAAWKRAWRSNAMWVACLCLNLLIFPHLFLTWHGDAMAPDRHALSVGVQLYLSSWIMLLLLASHAVGRAQRIRTA